MSTNIGQLKDQILALGKEEYEALLKQVHMEYPHRTNEMTNSIVNYWKRKQKEEVMAAVRSVAQSKAASSRQPVQPKASTSASSEGNIPSAALQRSSGPQSTVASSLLPWQQSAWKVRTYLRLRFIVKQGKANLFFGS